MPRTLLLRQPYFLVMDTLLKDSLPLRHTDLEQRAIWLKGKIHSSRCMDHIKTWGGKTMGCAHKYIFLPAFLRSCLLQLLCSAVTENVKVHRTKRHWCVAVLLGREGHLWGERVAVVHLLLERPWYLFPSLFSVCVCVSLSLCFSLSVCLSLSLTHTHTHIHTQSGFPNTTTTAVFMLVRKQMVSGALPFPGGVMDLTTRT